MIDVSDEDLLGRFSQSWMDTEKQYAQLIDEYDGFNFLVPLYVLIQRMKAEGEDRFFRLATANRKLLFSRSAEAQLRPEQQYLELEARENVFIATLKDARKMHRQFTLKDLDDERFTGLLQIVKDLPID
jgi:hypothetical protein